MCEVEGKLVESLRFPRVWIDSDFRKDNDRIPNTIYIWLFCIWDDAQRDAIHQIRGQIGIWLREKSEDGEWYRLYEDRTSVTTTAKFGKSFTKFCFV